MSATTDQSDASRIELLERARIVNPRDELWGSNGVWAVDLVVGGKLSGKAVYKPRKDEAPLWDFPDGTLYKRERAAFLTARALGWRFVPPTVIRDGPRGVGSLQWYIDHDQRQGGYQALKGRRDDCALIAVFDYLTNNADRKAAHCLLGLDDRTYGIDHGLTFHCDPKQRTFLGEFADCPVDKGTLARLRAWRHDTGNVARWRAQLSELLDTREIDGFLSRLDRLLAQGRLPDNRIRSYWYF